MLNLALVGLGFMAATHIKALRQVPGVRVAALCGGKRVICEKPFARTAAQAREMAVVAAETKRILMPAMCPRFFPEWEVFSNTEDAEDAEIEGKGPSPRTLCGLCALCVKASHPATLVAAPLRCVSALQGGIRTFVAWFRLKPGADESHSPRNRRLTVARSRIASRA